jgi:hypothetical protein
MSLLRSDNPSYIATRQLSPVQDRFQHLPRPWRQIVESDFFFRPQEDACPQAIRLHQIFHEAHLIDAHSQKEFSESRECFLA